MRDSDTRECTLFCIHGFFFYKKPRSKPSTKSFLIFGHILALKVS